MYDLLHKSTDIFSLNFRFKVDDQKFIQQYEEEQLHHAESSLNIYRLFILERKVNKISCLEFVAVEHL
jgi:hypothetical protein